MRQDEFGVFDRQQDRRVVDDVHRMPAALGIPLRCLELTKAAGIGEAV
jgi:hypothetical protein